MNEPTYCVAKDCEGTLAIVESESGIVWGGVCSKCGKHNEKCQKCGRFFVQMARHLRLVEEWPGIDNCLDGNPLWRTIHKAKDFGKGAP